jgi:hypothetical protein
MIKNGLHKTLAEVGKIKTGYRGEKITSKGGHDFAPPKKLDHFIVTTTVRGADGNFVENGDLMSRLGKEPRELKIRLPFDSIDKNFFTQFQAYEGGHKVCAGDGESALRKGKLSIVGEGTSAKLKLDGEVLTSIACDPDTCPILKAGKCKVSGILSCFLPESGDLGGVYKFRTHSWNAVSSILGALEFFASQTGGILMGMPLKLVMLKKSTEDHGAVNYATVVLDGEEIAGLRRLAIEERESRKLLALDVPKFEADAAKSGILDDLDPEDEVEAEWYTDDEEPAPRKGTSGADLAATLAAQAKAPPPAGELGLEVPAQPQGQPQSAPVAPGKAPGVPKAPRPAQAAPALHPSAAPAPRPADQAPKPAPAQGQSQGNNVDEDTIF